MTNPRVSVTLAFVPVAAALVLRHSWSTAFGQFLKRSANVPASVAPVKIGSAQLQDWQAAIAAYIILLGLSELDSAAPWAEAVAWAIGLVELASTLKLVQDKGVLNTSSSAPATAQPAPQPAPSSGAAHG